MSLHDSPSSLSQSTRKWTESSVAADSEATTQRTPDFWYEDSTIILQAQSTQFRVYRGIIARHSNVFRDMFAMPQPEGEPLLEGCPIVSLDDSPEDWKNVCAILYDSDTTYKSTDIFALPILSSMLRLGRKYELDRLYNAALDRIKLEIPDSLEQWEDKFGKLSNKKGCLDGKEVTLLHLLLEMDIRSLL